MHIIDPGYTPKATGLSSAAQGSHCENAPLPSGPLFRTVIRQTIFPGSGPSLLIVPDPLARRLPRAQAIIWKKGKLVNAGNLGSG